jgi:hypothetical protein
MAMTTSRLTTIAAAVGTLFFLGSGLYALVAPESFHDSLAKFEPYNQHYIQDIGAFSIGLGAVLLLAWLRPGLDALTVAFLGTGIGGVAHTISHIIGNDLGGNPERDIPFFTVIALVLLGAGYWRLRESTR